MKKSLLKFVCVAVFACVMVAQTRADDEEVQLLFEEIKNLKAELVKLAESRVNDSRTLVPPGTIVAYVGDTAPKGWLLCDGKTKLDKPEYADLKKVLKGAENVPNYCGYFLRGLDTAATVDPEGKTRVLGVPQLDMIRTHGHGASVSGGGEHVHIRQGKDKGSGGNGPFPNIIYPGDVGKKGKESQGARDDGANNRVIRNDHGERYGDGNGGKEYHLTRKDGTHTHTVSIVDHKGDETRPKNVAVNWIIKY